MPDQGWDAQGPRADGSGVDHYAETVNRELPEQSPPDRSAGSTGDHPPTRAYSAYAGAPAPRPGSPYGPPDPYAGQSYYPPPAAPPPHLGYPQPPQPSSSGALRGVLIGLAIAFVIVLIVACVVVWLKVAESRDTAQPAAPAAPTTVTATATESADPVAEAERALAAQADADAVTVRSSVDGRWVAQIGAKRPGLEAEGRRWDQPAILSEYRSMKDSHPNVLLLRSEQWPVFSSPGWWVVVSAQSFAGPDAALAWCASRSLDRDHCFAKLISSTRGPEGSTFYQR